MQKLTLRTRTKIALFSRGISISSIIVMLGGLCLGGTTATANAQTLNITGPPGNVKSGNAIVFTISLSGSTGLNVSAVEAALPNVGAGLSGSAPICTVGSSATAAGKTVVCGIIGSNVVALVSGLNANPMSDGIVANVQMTIPPATPTGTQIEGLTTLSAASAGGASLPVVASSPFSYAIINVSPCDINSDGVVDAKDYALAQTQITTGVGTAVDISGDGKFDSVDLQRIVNAIGGVCKVGS